MRTFAWLLVLALGAPSYGCKGKPVSAGPDSLAPVGATATSGANTTAPTGNETAPTPTPLPDARAPLAAAAADAGGGDAAACEARYDRNARAVLVGTTATAVPVPWRDDPDGIAHDHARVFSAAHGDGRLLVGLGVDTSGLHTYDTGNVLWSIDCAKPAAAPVAFLKEKGADFGHAVADPSGAYVFFAGATGLRRVRLADKRVDTVLDADRVDTECALYYGVEDGDEPPFESILPIAWSDDGLEVHVGGNCGYHGSWDLYRYQLVGDPAGEAFELATRVSVAALQRGPDGTLWLGDAGECSAPVFDQSSAGAVWRSDDGGVGWYRVPVDGAGQTDAEPVEQPITELVVDAKRAGHVAALSAICDGGAAAFGGTVLLTSDGGKTWRQAGEIGWTAGVDEGMGAARLWSPDGGVDHLFVAQETFEDDGKGDVYELRESKDGGETWRPAKGVAVPARASTTVTLPDGGRLQATARGLVRVAADGTRTRVFPPARLDIPTPGPGRSLELTTPRAQVTWAQVDAAEVANLRGLALAKKGELAMAIKAYEEAWAADPNHALSRYNAACAHALAGDSGAALALLEALSQMGGFRALSLLAAAREDADLKRLHDEGRFKALTTVGAVTSAFLDLESATPEVTVTIASDPAEQLCVWGPRASAKAGEGVWLDRVSCDDGAPNGFREVATAADLSAVARAAAEQDDLDEWDDAQGVTERDPSTEAVIAKFERADAWLQSLGMMVWEPIAADAPLHARAFAWLADKAKLTAAQRAAAREGFAAYLAPSGKRVAALAVLAGDGGARTIVRALGFIAGLPAAPAPR